MTPGAYLRQRREAADVAIDCLAMSPDVVAAIEADERSPTDMELTVLGWAFAFDEVVLGGIARGVVARLCRSCACSDDDACPEGESFCCWVEPDLCSACAVRVAACQGCSQ